MLRSPICCNAWRSGSVTRRRDPEDNRLVRVYLSDGGRKNERAITDQFLKLEKAIFDGISEDDRALFRRGLEIDGRAAAHLLRLGGRPTGDGWRCAALSN